MIINILALSALCYSVWTIFDRKSTAQAANPYLPLWEHIPDAEPRVFEDPDNPGKFRVYLYGSHDTRRDAYCGYDIPVWSAPVEDLNDWRYDGIGFESVVAGKADILFAPDVIEVVDAQGKKAYYLYPNNQGHGKGTQVARAERPDGPFEVINWKKDNPTVTEGVMGFDPSGFVDDDGRVYGYWGFVRSFAVELDPETMYSEKPGASVIHDLIGSCRKDDGNIFRFFEAPSVRKVDGKYILVYSRVTKKGEHGLGESNATLAYAYSNQPLGPWTYGGTIIDARGPEIGENGEMIVSQPSHNTHGGIVEVNGQWYITYHRAINNDGASRQATVEPINIEITPEGEVIITGMRPIKDNAGNEYVGAEVTSQGFEIDGLDPLKYHSAGITSYILGGPYVKATYDIWYDHAPVINIRNNSVVGYKYFNFAQSPAEGQSTQLDLYVTPRGIAGTIEIMLDSPWEKQGGTKLGECTIDSYSAETLTKITIPVPGLDKVEGKHPIFFCFKSEQDEETICDLEGLRFLHSEPKLTAPAQVELDEWDQQNLVPPTLTVSVGGQAVNHFEQSDYAYHVFECNYHVPAATTTPLKVTAEASDKAIEVEIQQATALTGKAIVSFSKDGKVKRYEISFIKP